MHIKVSFITNDESRSLDLSFCYKNEYVLLVSYPCVSRIMHAKRSEQKGPEEAKRSLRAFWKKAGFGSIGLSPDFSLAKGIKGNPGVTAIQGFPDHGVTIWASRFIYNQWRIKVIGSIFLLQKRVRFYCFDINGCLRWCMQNGVSRKDPRKRSVRIYHRISPLPKGIKEIRG